jgi:hypothetical protein
MLAPSGNGNKTLAMGKAAPVFNVLDQSIKVI